MVEMLVAVAILALLAAMWMSSDNPETANDRQRYDDAADVLYRLTQAIVSNNPTRGQTSFKWVITVYPSKLSDLTKPIVTPAGTNICGAAYGANTTKWINPFWSKELPTTGALLANGFTANDALVRLTAVPTLGGNQAGTMAIRMPSVTLADAKGLDLAVDGVLDGNAGTVRYSNASDPTQVDYYITIAGC